MVDKVAFPSFEHSDNEELSFSQMGCCLESASNNYFRQLQIMATIKQSVTDGVLVHGQTKGYAEGLGVPFGKLKHMIRQRQTYCFAGLRRVQEWIRSA